MRATVTRIEYDELVHHYGDGPPSVARIRLHFQWRYGEGSVTAQPDSELAKSVRVGDELEVQINPGGDPVLTKEEES